jgi:Mg-chelatase subunit ChlD
MKRMNGIEFRQGVEKAAHKIAADLSMSVTIEWTNGITTAAINSQGMMYLSSVKDDAVVTQALLEQYIGFVIHELLHRKYTEFGARSYDQYVAQLHNAVEDAFIERKGIKANLTGNIEPLLTTLIDSMVKKACAEVSDWSNPAQYPFVLAVYLREHVKTKCPLAKGLEPIFTEAAKRLNKCKNSHDTLTLAQWIYSQMLTLPKPKPPEVGNSKDKKQGDSKQGSEQGDTEGEKGSTSGDQGEGKGKGAGQGKNAPDQATSPEKSTAVEVEPTLGDSEHSDNSNGGTYSSEKIRMASEQIGKGLRFAINLDTPARLRFEVKKLFENSGTDEFQTNRRAGSLNVKALANINTSDRMFKRRLEVEGIDSAVVIMLDLSGSMFDNKKAKDDYGKSIRDAEGNYVYAKRIEQALNATAALMDTLNRAHVKVALVTFGCEVALSKAFDKPTQATIRALSAVRNCGSTNDYQALRFSHEILHARNETRKVVFVLTDGLGNAQATKEQAISGENLGITTIGIGIGESVSSVYPKSVMVRDGKSLGDASFKQIKLAA